MPAGRISSSTSAMPKASGLAQLVVGERYEYAEFLDQQRDKYRATDLRLLSQA